MSNFIVLTIISVSIITFSLAIITLVKRSMRTCIDASSLLYHEILDIQKDVKFLSKRGDYSMIVIQCQLQKMIKNAKNNENYELCDLLTKAFIDLVELSDKSKQNKK